MSFDWSEYLKLAKQLAGEVTASANHEAKLRDAVSKAYYAAFITAINYLRDKQGYSISTTGEVHQYVHNQFNTNMYITNLIIVPIQLIN